MEAIYLPTGKPIEMNHACTATFAHALADHSMNFGDPIMVYMH
jgi:hypothetical protein